VNQAADPLDLDRIEKDVSDTAEAVQKVWIIFVSFFSVFGVLITTVDHVTLLSGTTLEVPLLKVSVPFTSFFSVGPCIAVCLHAYMLVQLLILSRKLEMYEDGIRSSIRSDTLGDRHRLGLSPFVHYLSGFESSSQSAAEFLIRLFVIGTIMILPVVVLLLSLLTILPYHNSVVLWINRICVVTVLILLAIFWPKISGLSRCPRRH
jgi:hypothetical protein